MAQYKIVVAVGSLRRESFNRKLADAVVKLAPAEFSFEHLEIGGLPLYDQDDDAHQSAPVLAMKAQISAAQGVMFVTPEYNRSIPGALKNAIDWASRPWGKNSFDHMPAAVIGASVGQIGTAVAQQSLRGVLSFCNARQMTAPEAYVYFRPEIFGADGEVTDEVTVEFLRNFMAEFGLHTERVLTVLPRA